MKIAYEYSIPSSEQLIRFGLEAVILQGAPGLAVTAFDGEEPIGFGYVRGSGSDASGDCCIQVHPAYGERQIDANIRKLLHARTLKPRVPQHVCV